MNLSFPLASNDPSLPLQEVLGLYRRICILRQQGRTGEAQALQSERLIPALGCLEAEGAIETASLETRLAGEARRVEDAALLAELILPFLPAASATGKPAPDQQTPPHHPSARSRPAAGNVAAFIDDMLAQRPADRRR